MKKTDIAMIIFILAVSGGLAFAAVSAIPGLKLSDDPVQVKVIEKYDSTLPEPNKDIFNSGAINPTVDITVGGTANKNDSN